MWNLAKLEKNIKQPDKVFRWADCVLNSFFRSSAFCQLFGRLSLTLCFEFSGCCWTFFCGVLTANLSCCKSCTGTLNCYSWQNACVMHKMRTYISLVEDLRRRRCAYTREVRKLGVTLRQLFIIMSQKCHGVRQDKLPKWSSEFISDGCFESSVAVIQFVPSLFVFSWLEAGQVSIVAIFIVIQWPLQWIS